MKNKKTIQRFAVPVIILAFLAGPALRAQAPKPDKEMAPVAELRLKVFEGVKEGKVEPIRTVTSSFLRYTLSASIKSEDTSEKEENQLRRVFNLKSVQLLTEANLSWSKIPSKDFHLFRLDSKEYAIVVTLVRVSSSERVTCRLEVMEQDKDRKSSLLDSELSLDKKVITTFGFEDNSGQPYFLSLRVLGIGSRTGAGEAAPSGQVGGVIGGAVTAKPAQQELRQKAEETGKEPSGVIAAKPAQPEKPEELKDVVKATGDIKPPRLIKKVQPVYPEGARKSGVEGIVILEVTTDKTGKVAAVKVLRSVPLLDEAAIEAVKQWEYEPVLINGQPRPLVFTVTVNFKLQDEEKIHNDCLQN